MASVVICVSGTVSVSFSAGRSRWKRLLHDVWIIPGCRPRKGTSKLIRPKMLCFRCWCEYIGEDGRRATSAAKIPPRLCPSRMISRSSASWGDSLCLRSGLRLTKKSRKPLLTSYWTGPEQFSYRLETYIEDKSGCTPHETRPAHPSTGYAHVRGKRGNWLRSHWIHECKWGGVCDFQTRGDVVVRGWMQNDRGNFLFLFPVCWVVYQGGLVMERRPKNLAPPWLSLRPRMILVVFLLPIRCKWPGRYLKINLDHLKKKMHKGKRPRKTPVAVQDLLRLIKAVYPVKCYDQIFWTTQLV